MNARAHTLPASRIAASPPSPVRLIEQRPIVALSIALALGLAIGVVTRGK